MSVFVSLELHCDECFEVADYTVAGHQGARELREVNKVDGWTRRKRQGVFVDLCPDHSTPQEPS